MLLTTVPLPSGPKYCEVSPWDVPHSASTPTSVAWGHFPEAGWEEEGGGAGSTTAEAEEGGEYQRGPTGQRQAVLTMLSLPQGTAVAGEEVQCSPAHGPELPQKRVLPQLLPCQHPVLQPLLPIPQPQGLPQVSPEPVRLLWEKVSAPGLAAAFPPEGADAAPGIEPSVGPWAEASGRRELNAITQY